MRWESLEGEAPYLHPGKAARIKERYVKEVELVRDGTAADPATTGRILAVADALDRGIDPNNMGSERTFHLQLGEPALQACDLRRPR